MKVNKFFIERVRVVRGKDLKLPLILSLSVLFLVMYGFFFGSPSGYPIRTVFTIEEGQTVSEVAHNLKEAGIIRSPFLFKTVVYVLDGDHGVMAGDYYLNRRHNIFTISHRMANAVFGLSPVRFFVPEGLNVFQLADRVSIAFPSIDRDDFLEEAGGYEGYLFPDTYLILPNAKPKTIIKTMIDNFDKQMIALAPRIELFHRSAEDVIKMASILEREARMFETKRIIAGILWKRIEEGIPLQVDAAFQYVNGKNTFELTLDDLKTDSPYNTYVNRGLPPTPIASPGLDSILAAITPAESDYYFFLTDHDGNMRYAITHDEHVENKYRYLR